MILEFKDAATLEFWQNGASRKLPPEIQRVAMRKLKQLHDAAALEDLRVPPGNRLEALRADRKGQFSIRINERFRVCFEWSNGNAYGVEIVDYH